MVTAVKAATVFVKIKSKELAGSGSGFVIRVDGDTAYIVTNRHVVEPKVAEIVVERRPGGSRNGSGRRRGVPGFPQPMVPQPPFPSPFPVPGQQDEPRYSARVVVREFKNVDVTAVFQSGTTHEESVSGKIVAIDPDEDLAVVKVTGVKQPPKTIDYLHEGQLTETMPVYVFGFPLGEVLSTSKRSPAITVGKGTVSSLRTDDDGDLAMVQIDAALNHGNSGGPVVDAQGRLVGVAVARITEAESQNLGMAIPTRAVSRLLRGRVDKAVLTAVKESDDKVSIQVTAALIDPLNTIKSTKLQYVNATAVTDKPKPTESLEKLPGCRTLELKVEDGVASGKITLKKGITEVSLLHQSVSIDESGKRAVSESAVNRVALVLRPTPPQITGNPGAAVTGQKAAARPGGSIGIHFIGRSSPFLGTGGVVPMPSWNNEAGTTFSGVSLVDNRGAKSGATFSLVNALGSAWSTGSRNELLNGYVTSINFQPMTLTINRIPYARYSIYVYFGDALLHDDAKVTVNGTTYYYSPMGGEPVGYNRVTSTNPAVHELGNYIEAGGLSGASQTVVMAGSTQQYSGLCGVEIVDTSKDAGAKGDQR
jgi:S1-C subfamily serine protease